jgi:hypothetical protein
MCRPTSACTRPPTARFFKGSAPAKALVSGSSLAGPVSGDARRWAAEENRRWFVKGTSSES